MRSHVTRWRLLLGAWASLAVFCPSARSQAPPAPDGGTPVPVSLDQIAERIQALERMNKDLAERLERTTREHDERMKQILEKVGEPSKRPGDAKEGGGQKGAADQPADTAGNGTPPAAPSPVPDYLDLDITSPNKFGLKATFGPGFQLQTEDEQFRLQIHYESQIEGRGWLEGELPANSGLYLPRQRFFFNGNITQPIEYELAINRGLNNINLLNAFVNIHADDQFQVRFGRFFTPQAYEQYAISNYWLLTPERSLFTTNIGLNRQIGLMALGSLFDKRLDYAAGVFNGSRNSFESLNNNVDVVAYLNARPFQESETLPFARYLNVGASVGFGPQDQAPVPRAFRIGAGSPDTNIPGPATVPFLVLNPDVIERGGRVIGSVHAAYFYKSLSLIGEWQYGYAGYATPAQPSSVRVPFSGFYVAGGYFLTGEEVERRTRVKPLRPLVPLTKGEGHGPGAWELAARVSQLRLGDSVFNSGFADPNVWSNSAVTTELGMNWYWNEYVKVYAFWLHGEFGDPVQFRPGLFQKSADMLWLRWQLYF